MTWSMLPLGATGELGEWLNNRPPHQLGNTMDGVNIQLVITPPDDVLAAVERVVILPAEANTPELVGIIGASLSSGSDVVILGTEHQFTAAYNTPYWRLWCATNPVVYDSDADPRFTKDLDDAGLPTGTIRAAAREIIKSLVGGNTQ